MVNNGVDVILAGHEHNYQRWSTLNANGQVSSVGTTQYIVGSGGHSQDGANVSDSRTQFFRSGLGVLSMQLNPNGGTAQYITTAGAVVDSSTLNCNNGGGGTSTPTPTSTTPPGGSTTTLNPVADARVAAEAPTTRSEEHTSELQSRENLVCRLLLEKKKKKKREHQQRTHETKKRAPTYEHA